MEAEKLLSFLSCSGGEAFLSPKHWWQVVLQDIPRPGRSSSEGPAGLAAGLKPCCAASVTRSVLCAPASSSVNGEQASVPVKVTGRVSWGVRAHEA